MWRAPPARNLSVGGGIEGRKLTEMGGEHAPDLLAGDDLVEGPLICGAHVHEFDEANRDAKRSKVLDQRNQLAFVDAGAYHAVDLHPEANRTCLLDALQRGFGAMLDVAHGAIDRRAERIH